MSEIKIDVAFPVDEDGYFRRECPLCAREFKILPTDEEMQTFCTKGLDSFLLEVGIEQEAESGAEDTEITCPYCGQRAPVESWWTEEQGAYIQTYLENIVAKAINEQFIKPMKRQYGSSSGLIHFKGGEMDYKEPWISPEENDMKLFNLPCCDRTIKIAEDWNSTIYCFTCCFPHQK